MRGATDPTVVFGLTKADLWPIVEAAAGEPVTHFEVAVEHEVQGPYGFAAEKLIPTFRYITARERTGAVTIFGKHHHNARTNEAEHYRLLNAHGVPVPRMYGSMRSPAGRPVLFLEYLPPKPTVTHVSERFLPYLELMGRFNATPPNAAYRAWMEANCCDLLRNIGDAEPVLSRIWQRAYWGHLGPELKQFCAEHHGDLKRLRRLVRELRARAADMEFGLIHTDFSHENVGRRASGEFVLLDLEPVRYGPRFFDVSYWLAFPGRPWNAELDPQDLLRHYLDSYTRHGGEAPPIEEFVAELDLLAHAYMCCYLGFGFGGALGSPSNSPEDAKLRTEFRSGLQQWLRLLLVRCDSR